MKKLKKKIELIKNKHSKQVFNQYNNKSATANGVVQNQQIIADQGLDEFFNKMRKILLYIFFLFLSITLNGQVLFHQDLCNCGVTGAGFSVGGGAGSGSFDVYIEPGSIIKKAWLFAQRYSNAYPVNILINGVNYNFNSTNQITQDFSVSGSKNSAIHGLDVTNDINPTITNYNITIPPQVITRYGAIYLWIEYEKSTLPLTNSIILLNNKDLNSLNTNYNITNITPINTNYPVGFTVYTDILRDTVPPYDGSYVYFNGNLLGLIGGSDYNSVLWDFSGVKGHFYYQNNTLFGLGDDTPDSLMIGTDGLADVSSYLNNNDTFFNFRLQWQNIGTSNAENYYLGFFFTYSTPCDTFTSTATTNTDTICAGESVQLTATGGATYSWFSAFSTFNDSTLANPIATPTQTTTYIVTIKNALGCVKTEHVKVWVHPAPKPDTITTTPQRCGSADGSITVGNIPNGTPPFNYQLTNLATGNLQSQISNSFNNLLAANYLLQITDSNGCQWQSDTLFLPEINDITANFSVYTLPWVFPFNTNPMGEAPLTVYTQNSSVNANSFEWWVSDSSGQIASYLAMTNPNFNFDSGGTFEICLFAYNNIPACGDTVCKTISITPNLGVDSLVLIVPNVFSPNHDGSNDSFVLQVLGADLLESLKVEIFNRWGQVVNSFQLIVDSLPLTNNQHQITIWDGTTTTGTEVSEGTYFYVVNYTKKTGEKESLKGTVTLLR